MKKSIQIILAVFCALVVFTGCPQRGGKGAQGEEKETIFAVNTMPVEIGSLDDYLEFGGDISPVSSVDIYPDQSGKLSSLSVSVGDYVYKDQVIGGVDASRPGMNFEISPIEAPVSGTISSLPISIGMTVGPSVSVGKISSVRNLEIVTYIPERFVSRIAMNQLAFLTFDAFPGETFEAHITEINPVLDPSTRTMKVTLLFDETDERVRAGMYTRIKLITQNIKDVIVVPYDAVVSRSGETYVFTVRPDNTAEKRIVMPGLRVDDLQEIISGLEVGERIVTRGQTLLDDGAKVNVLSQ